MVGLATLERCGQADGKPIEDARLRLLSRQRNPETGQIVWRITASGRARDGAWRCDKVTEGEYLLQVTGRDIAALARRIQLTAGAPKLLKIECARGVDQSFEIALLPDSRYRFAVLKVHDLDGNEILSKYEERVLADPRHTTLRTTVRMLPGTYSVAVRGYPPPRLQGMVTGHADTRIEVPEGGGPPIRLVLR